ncbi:MAG: caspase family protein [Bacteroidetes bacterium]|nr:caspase family protein [Bacteroidota bacterium]
MNGNEMKMKRAKKKEYHFDEMLSIPDTISEIHCVYSDIYDNIDTAYIIIQRLGPENSGILSLINPPGFISEEVKEVYIDSDREREVLFKGKIQSQYTIVNVTVNGVTAVVSKVFGRSYEFEANISVTPLDTLVNVVYEIEGEESQTLQFKIEQKDAKLSTQQTSGRTWVVIISNSIYDNYTDLEGVNKDVNALSNSLQGYQIQRIIRKHNLKHKEMSSFLSKELKRKVEDAQVKTLILWYAGHGEPSGDGEDSYWIPVDAKQNMDGEGYLSLRGLQQDLNNINGLNNLLVISDACNTGLAFIDKKRGSESFGTCELYEPEPGKSYYVLTSALADNTSDNSVFAEMFSEYLSNPGKKNSNCVNLLDVANIVQEKLQKFQDVQFGQLRGLDQRKNPSFFLEKKR